ncbi:MAG TPA: two-component regulator propeller domain-containing protein [Thermoanaerobaculia bacterium]
MSLLKAAPVALLMMTAAAAGAPLEREWVAQTYTVEDGLPLNAITDMTWSRDGYLWLTTFDGLARFDGARFTTFTSATEDGLFGNRLTVIEEDDAGWLWISTEQNQLVRRSPYGAFQTVTGTEEFPPELVHCLERDPWGTLWVCGDRAIGRISAGRITPAFPVDGPTPLAILHTSDSALLIGNEEEVVRLSPNQIRWKVPRVRTLAERSSGELLAGTVDGLWRLTAGGRAELIPGTRGMPVHRVEERDGITWIFAGERLMRWDDTSLETIVQDGFVTKTSLSVTTPFGTLVHSAHDLFLDGELVLRTAGAISSVLAGPEGNLWVATARGLIRLRPSLFRTIAGDASRHRFYPVVIDDNGSILAGTIEQGWIEVDPASGVVQGHDRPRNVRTIVRDRSGALWIGGDGLCRMERGQCRTEEIPSRLRQSAVLALALDSTGALWAGSVAGLFRRLSGGAWEQIQEAGTGEANVVRVIAESGDGTLWFGAAGNGLVRWQDGILRRFTVRDGLPSNLIRSLLADSDGALWIGTENYGIAHARPRPDGSLVISAIGKSNGLLDDNVNQILDDGAGRLWISSNRGIAWVARSDLEEFVSGNRDRVRSTGYNERHGLPDRETNGGVQSAGTVDRDGRLWFPTQAGLVGIDPATISFTRDPPPVRLETLTTRSRTLPARGEVRLDSSERDFEIDYAALSFTTPERVRFRYRLVGLDRDWNDVGSRRTAVYTNVPPGAYRFQVIASHEGETWSPARSELGLVVPPRAWETGWFRIGALFLLLAMIPAAAHMRTYQLLRRQYELEDKVSERTRELEEQKKLVENRAATLAEVDRMKSVFFADVSHELRTPLTMIIGPVSDLLEDPEVAPEVRQEMGIVRRNALRLLRLVNQILDLLRLESSGLELDLRTRDLIPVLEWLMGTFRPLADRCGVTLSLETEGKVAPVRCDREEIDKVFGNLLSNAIKFTPMGGRVSVRVREEVSEIVVAVSDTGPGIAPEDLERIFERFVRSRSDAPLQQGTGLGLALARQLTRLHGGTIEVDSSPREGSTFRVRLPRSNDPLVDAGLPAATGPDFNFTSGEGPEIHPIAESLADASGEIGQRDTLVLVVDDDDDVRRYVTVVLETSHRVVTARDGAEGLALAQEHLPDLIVSDVMMPVLDGFGLVRALRGDPMTEPVPVILLTARASETDEVEGLGTGADDYLPKPFSSRVLRARVNSILERRRALLVRLRAEMEGSPARRAAGDTFEGRVRQVVDEHLEDETFTADRLAVVLGVSRSVLERAVREACGATPTKIVREARLERAAALLAEGRGSVSEIAFASGFRGLAQFSRAFRTRYGVAPSQWKAGQRSEAGG